MTAKAAVAIDNARRYSRERTTALTLQRSLLPQGLPNQEAVEVASRYLPTGTGYLPAGTGAEVGGDWFDAVPLSGARVALVVGDVVGHGLHAAAGMGLLRTAVRTLADVDLPPDELLTHLDDLVVEPDPAQVPRAGKFAVDQVDAWGLEEASFVTELVVSELVTNAIRYGEPPIRLR